MMSSSSTLRDQEKKSKSKKVEKIIKIIQNQQNRKWKIDRDKSLKPKALSLRLIQLVKSH